jgi:ribosomal protein S18 acetylase RimI-like enzyme
MDVPASHSSMLSREFSPDLIGLVQGFDCGDDDWSLRASQWISGPPVLKSMSRGTRVWLYSTLDGRIIGFGSLGTTTWHIPHPNGEARSITMLAIAREFQGQPVGEASCRTRFSGQIIADLISKAVILGNPDLALLVSEGNVKAQSLYEKFGFVRLPDYIAHSSIIAMVKRIVETVPLPKVTDSMDAPLGE